MSGETYTLRLGGTSTAPQTDGLYETGGYQGDGTEEGSVTLDDTVCFIGTAGNMGGMMGGLGGFVPGDAMPGEMPTDANGESIIPGGHPGGMPGERRGRPGEQTTEAATG